MPDQADATELHRYAEALLVHLAADDTAPPLPPETIDVPGHWLPPAMRSLVLIMTGADATAPLAQATGLDAERTSLFLCLALAVSGHGDRVHASWLGTAFGDLRPDRPVSTGQRALWLAAARGAYGPAGKIFVLRKLDAIDVPAQDDLWLSALIPEDVEPALPPSLTGFPDIARIPALATPVEAADRLSRLRARVEQVTGAPQTPEAFPTAPGAWPDTEPMTVLRALVGKSSGDSVEGPLSSLSGHLLHDVKPGADPHLSALALRVAAPAVQAAAERLAAGVVGDPPATITVPILGHPITLRPEGPDPGAMADAERRIVVGVTRRRPSPAPAYALTAAGLLTSCLALFLSPLFAPPGLAGACLGGLAIWRRRQRERADLTFVDARVAELRDLANAAVWALHEYAREAAKRSATAADDLVTLNRLLRRGPRAGQ